MMPPGCEVDGDGHLASAGHDLTDLAARFGTPLYIFNEEVIRARCRAYRHAFATYAPGVRVAYAGKAFLTTAMAALIAEEGLHLDVVSGGELQTALSGGMPAERIHFHGNNKLPAEVEFALTAGIGCTVIDNFYELDLVADTAARLHQRADVLLRVAPGVEAHAHAYMQTGKQDSKFGFDLESGQALAAARLVIERPSLRLRGLHAHIGSQLLDTAAYTIEVARLITLAAAIRRDCDAEIHELNIGGGLGIRYVDDDVPPEPEAVAGAVIAAVTTGCRAHDLPLPVLACEPGRSIVGPAGIALYTVGASKRVPGLTPYVAVDGGMGDNIRPALYGATYTVVVANRMHQPHTERVHVVGRYCESGDFLAKDAPVPELRPGDLLAFFGAGAYQLPMASNYNRVPRPAAVLVSQGHADLILARESVEDLLRQDRMPEHLARAGAGARGPGQRDAAASASPRTGSDTAASASPPNGISSSASPGTRAAGADGAGGNP
ncbi:MAG TPA: diaminopimelate decarboxylase [Bacillota bacterium]|nr:diaminopimelate decarboxylase [Bacillota bacterium]